MKPPSQIDPKWLLAMLYLKTREAAVLAEKVEKLQRDKQLELGERTQ